MKPELEQKLLSKYPKLYGKHNLPMSETCMCWGFDVPDEWYDTIDDLSNKLTKIAERDNIEIQAEQVKSKFGQLRYYLGFIICSRETFDEIYEAVDEAELLVSELNKNNKMNQ